MEIIRDIHQGTPEWDILRVGSLGGSSISKATAVSKEAKQRTQLLYDMAGEIISGKKKEHFTNQNMLNGTEFENEARLYYSLVTGNEVETIAMIKDGPHKHVSPDGLCDSDGIIEIKNVIPSTFVAFIDKPSIPTAYRKQMQWGMARSRRTWCDYVLYCKDFVGQSNPMIITKVARDEKEIRELEDGADKFINELLALVERVRGG